jgi:hypothetical protein
VGSGRWVRIRSVFEPFVEIDPELESYWRAAILLGRNSASFKFALGRALLELAGEGRQFATLEELAVPYSRELRGHLREADRQGTSAGSRFLDALRAANRGESSDEEAVAATAKLGFVNVIDAFHVVRGEEMNVRFFVDERGRHASGVRFTDELQKLVGQPTSVALSDELESRWNLVETGWKLDLPSYIVGYEEKGDLLVPESVTGHVRRQPITRARAALSGYNKGRCFYCSRPISIESASPELCDVDHFFPWSLGAQGLFAWPDGIWNLVLSCADCNRGASGKFDRIPSLDLVKRLYRRNEWLYRSYLPLRETLAVQIGSTPRARRHHLQRTWQACLPHIGKPWDVADVERPRI